MEAAALIARIRTGSPDAFEEVVEKYQYPVTRYLYRLTGDYETAKDLAQDTFIKAYKGILRTDSELRLNAWLYKIATNTAIQHLRRKKTVSFISFENLGKSKQANNGSRSDNTIEDLAIKEALGEIPWEQRICVVLHYIEGFKYREIAETMNISEEAVRKRVARGVLVFRRFYDGGKRK